MKIFNPFFMLLFLTVFVACSNEEVKEQLNSQTTTMKIPDNDIRKDLWESVPIYQGSTLESTKDCPGKWAKCETCEHRIYVTDEVPADVCSFFKDEMLKRGWMKLTYQFYPEGSCLATWMKDDTRVIFNAANRRSDNKTFIAITLGKGYP